MRPLLITVAAVFVLVAAGCGSGTGESVPPENASDAPAIQGVTIDGKRLSLADFRGQPVFVNVWSSW